MLRSQGKYEGKAFSAKLNSPWGGFTLRFAVISSGELLHGGAINGKLLLQV